MEKTRVRSIMRLFSIGSDETPLAIGKFGYPPNILLSAFPKEEFEYHYTCFECPENLGDLRYIKRMVPSTGTYLISRENDRFTGERKKSYELPNLPEVNLVADSRSPITQKYLESFQDGGKGTLVAYVENGCEEVPSGSRVELHFKDERKRLNLPKYFGINQAFRESLKSNKKLL